MASRLATFGFFALLLLGTGLAADEPARVSTDTKTNSRDDSRTTPKTDKKSSLSLDKLKLPQNAIFVICDEVGEAVRLLPKAVVLTPEKYQELLEQLEAARRPARAEKPELPGVCKLSLKVEGNDVRVRATYEFVTQRPRTTVALGCQRAWPASANMDDLGLPALEGTEEGWIVHVEKPGNHRLTMELMLGLLVRGTRSTERGVDLGLPRAAITLLDKLELPGPITEVRLGTRSLRPRAVSDTLAVVENVALGPVDRLDLTWKAATPGQSKGTPLLASRARIQARIDETHVFTEVDLTMEVLREETSVWRIYVPLAPQATLEKPVITDERIQSISYPDQKNPEMTIRFKEPSAEPLRLTLQVRQPRLGGPVAIGPFPVMQALAQTGTIEVRAPNDLRLRYRLRPEVSQREVTQDPRLDQTVASFAYWNLAAPTAAGQTVPAPVTLEVDLVRGNVEARVLHTLRLQDTTIPERSPWRITTRIEATPYRSGVDRMEVQLPAGYQLDRDAGVQPTELVEEVQVDPETQVAQIRFAQRQLRPFQITLTGTMVLASGIEGRTTSAEAAVELPRPLVWMVDRGPGLDRRTAFLDQGGQVSIVVPEGFEVQPRSGMPDVPRRSPRELIWQAERSPTRAEWIWRRYRPELLADILVDADLGPRYARVQQRIHFTSPSGTLSQVRLDVPLALRERVQILSGGKPVPGVDPSSGQLTVSLEKTAEREADLVLLFVVPLSETSLEIPLARPEAATRGQTRVRVWSEGGVRLAPGVGRWEELPLEIVAERRNTLPSLVAQGGLIGSISLERTENRGLGSAIIVERALFQVRMNAAQGWVCQARYFLPRLTTRRLEIELPDSVERSALEVLIEERQAAFQLLDQVGAEITVGRIARLTVEPELYHGPVTLTVTFPMLASERQGSWAALHHLRPPTLAHSMLLGQVRWLIEGPGKSLFVPLAASVAVEQRWRWSGWLAAPRPAFTAAELEAWLSGRTAPEAEGLTFPSLVCSQASLEPLVLGEVQHRIWLLGCSLVLLSGAWLLSMAHGSHVRWALAAVLAVVLLGAILCPDVLPLLVYGAQPGVLIILLFVGFSWMLRRRYERQLVFMPAFSRVKGGSSLGRLPVRAREPSTVDNPARRGSSAVAEAPPETRPS